jgi:hypothetical protein
LHSVQAIVTPTLTRATSPKAKKKLGAFFLKFLLIQFNTIKKGCQ